MIDQRALANNNMITSQLSTAKSARLVCITPIALKFY